MVAYHLVQTHHHLQDSHRYLVAAQHARIPREGAVGILQLLEFPDSHLQAVVDAVLVEKVSQSLFLFALTVGSTHPRCLVQDEVLEFLVLLE